MLGQGTYYQFCIIFKKDVTNYTQIVRTNYSLWPDLVYCRNFEISESMAMLLEEELNVTYKVFLDGKVFLRLRNPAYYRSQDLIDERNEMFTNVLHKITEHRKVEISSTAGVSSTKFKSIEEFWRWIREVYDSTFISNL